MHINKQKITKPHTNNTYKKLPSWYQKLKAKESTQKPLPTETVLNSYVETKTY